MFDKYTFKGVPVPEKKKTEGEVDVEDDWFGKHKKDLDKASAEGIQMGSPLYTKFNRLLAGDMLEICSASTYRQASRQKKAEFRKEWAVPGLDSRIRGAANRVSNDNMF